MNNSDHINLDLCLGRPCPEENPLFSSPSSSGVDPSLCKYDLQSSLFQTLKMNNPDGDDMCVDLCLSIPCPEETPEHNPEENPEHDPEENPEHNPEENPYENPEEHPEENPEDNPEENPEENPEPNPEDNPLFSSPSSSGVDPSLYKYDVFISFRGEDTRLNFTSHLYKALCQNRIRAFIDEDRLEKGDDVSRALPKAIEESAISIIIFSTNYASSTWCLDELVHILKYKKDKDHIAVPIFHGIDPSDIRKQKRSYADAFVEHQQRFNNAIDKVQEWRQALKEASGICGWDSRGKSEADIVEKVVKDVQEKLQYMGSNGRIEDLLKRLKTKLRSANIALNDAEEKQLTNQVVKEWIDDLKEVIFRADELMDKLNYEKLRRKLEGASESSTSFATFNESVEDEIAEILLKLEELTAQKDELGLKELTENIVSLRSYGAPLDLESEVYGRKDDKEAILKLVLSDEDCGDRIPVVLPIVGIGGIGKTTLAQLVYEDGRVKNHFEIQVWVTISTEFDVFNITKKIFEEVTFKKFKRKEISQLQRELREALEGKKYLFVLDDVWNEDYLLWDQLRRPFRYGKSGSKIIITTRSSNVALTVSRVEAHKLGELSDENCWKIFIQHAFENEDLLSARPDLQKIGEGIVQKCKGLPLAVKSVAALLRSISGLDEWRKILDNRIWDLKLQENARKYVLPTLWLSYRHLSPQLKRCFAYCSIFPKDHEFDKEDLILLWMGEGLLEARGGTRMEDVGEEYFKILTSRSFFQPSVRHESCFIMHDCVHDCATFVLGDFGFWLEDNNLHNLPSKTRHLSIMREKIHDLKQFDVISNAKCLRTCLLLGYNPIHYGQFMVPLLKLLMEQGCLRVLSLKNCPIAELPDSIGNLKQLRYLDLSCTPIKEIPDTICTLYNLETLLLIGYYDLTRLPTDIGCLIKLRHLDCSETFIEELPLGIFNMKDLQTLRPSSIRGKTGAVIVVKNLVAFLQLPGKSTIKVLAEVVDGKNVCKAKLRDMKFITELRLCWNSYSVDSNKEREILDYLQPHTNLKELCIEGYSGIGFLDWMGDQSFSSIVKVELFRCENCWSLWPLDQLPSLKTLLIVDSFSGVKTINWEFFSKPCRSLESLCLQGMRGLKEWLFREGEVGFPTLKELRLFKCRKLEVRLLPDCFPSLTKLKVEDCRQLRLIPATHQGSIFPCLRELEIKTCPQQELILEGGLFSSLEIITVIGCRNVKEWLFREGEVGFPTLKELRLFKCRKLEVRLLPDCFPSLTKLKVEDCRQLRLIPATHQGLIFPCLRELEIKTCPQQELILEGGLFSSLEIITVIGCRNVKEWLFREGEVGFPTLKELRLFKCRKLEVRLLPDCFPSLTKLKVVFCRQLKLIPATHQGLIFPSLQELEIGCCPKQEFILEGGLPSSLERIKIYGCHNLKALDDNGFRQLTSLRRLKIECCKELQCLPELPSYPFELVIMGCPLLNSRC